MNIIFCCTNVDLHSLAEVNELERLGLPLQLVQCLGLCHYCAQGKLALIGDDVVIADNQEAFRQALRTSLKRAETPFTTAESDMRPGPDNA